MRTLVNFILIAAALLPVVSCINCSDASVTTEAGTDTAVPGDSAMYTAALFAPLPDKEAVTETLAAVALGCAEMAESETLSRPLEPCDGCLSEVVPVEFTACAVRGITLLVLLLGCVLVLLLVEVVLTGRILRQMRHGEDFILKNINK